MNSIGHRLTSLLLVLFALLASIGIASGEISAFTYDGAGNSQEATPNGPSSSLGEGPSRQDTGETERVNTPGVGLRLADDFVAPQTPLYRAVTDAEVSDLRAVDRFRAGPGYEGKLFATSPADAARFGQLNYGLKGGEPFHIVETRVSSSTFESLYRDRMDGMPAVFVDASQFDTLAAPSIWDSVPWTPKGGN